MALVVRKNARNFVLATPQAKRARMAYATARYVYANRATVARAARRIGRAWRRYRRNRTSRRFHRVGNRVGTGNAKRATTLDFDDTSYSSRTLNTHSILDIVEGTAINQRERKLVNVSGVKLCMELRGDTAKPLYFNMALLSPKGAQSAIATSGFFRGNGATRDQDFNISLSGNEFHCLPINADKYNIHAHWRYRLVPFQSPTNTIDLVGRSYKNIDKYIRIKRQFRYDGASGSPEMPVYLVHWSSGFAETGGTAAALGAYHATIRAVVYFKEAKT